MEELGANDRDKIDVSFWDDVAVHIGEMFDVERATDDIVATAQTRASWSSSSRSSNTTMPGAGSDVRRLRNLGITPEDMLAEVYEHLGVEGRAASRFGRKHSGTYLEPIHSIGGASLKTMCGNKSHGKGCSLDVFTDQRGSDSMGRRIRLSRRPRSRPVGS